MSCTESWTGAVTRKPRDKKLLQKIWILHITSYIAKMIKTGFIAIHHYFIYIQSVEYIVMLGLLNF